MIMMVMVRMVIMSGIGRNMVIMVGVTIFGSVVMIIVIGAVLG